MCILEKLNFPGEHAPGPPLCTRSHSSRTNSKLLPLGLITLRHEIEPMTSSKIARHSTLFVRWFGRLCGNTFCDCFKRSLHQRRLDRPDGTVFYPCVIDDLKWFPCDSQIVMETFGWSLRQKRCKGIPQCTSLSSKHGVACCKSQSLRALLRQRVIQKPNNVRITWVTGGRLFAAEDNRDDPNNVRDNYMETSLNPAQANLWTKLFYQETRLASLKILLNYTPRKLNYVILK